MLPIQRKISAYNHYNSNNVKYIILHYTGNRGDTAKNNVDYFYGGDRSASAHYFVDDNSIWQSVEDFHGAWHIGNSVHAPCNQNSIGIEMCCKSNGEISAQTEQNALELTRYLMKKYNVPVSNVWTHYETTKGGENKICPNWSANNWARWNNFKSKLVQRKNFTIEATANVQDEGIKTYRGTNSLIIGTTGQGKRLEAISISVSDINIKYDVHMQDVGDIKGNIEGQIEGSIGQAKRLEGITINVVSIPSGYTLKYRSHCQSVGWGNWCTSGQYAGTKGQGLRMEAIEIKIE